MFLSLSGSNAITVSLAANRQCEIHYPNGQWKTSSGQQEAMRAFRESPELVRLRADARVLLEDITGATISPTADITVAAGAIDTTSLNVQQASAVTIIKESLS